MTSQFTLADLGWSPFFQQQLSLEELETLIPARVFEVHRTGLTLRFEPREPGEVGEVQLPLGGRWFQGLPEERPTVGDFFTKSSLGPITGTLMVLALRDTQVITTKHAG